MTSLKVYHDRRQEALVARLLEFGVLLHMLCWSTVQRTMQ